MTNELELTWEGHGSNPTSQIVSNLKANKMFFKGLVADKNLSYEEVSIEILDHQVKQLRNKEFATVKVLRKNYLVLIPLPSLCHDPKRAARLV